MKKYLLYFVLFSLFFPLFVSEVLAGNLSGYILLQVEENGEAWYVNPQDDVRHYLGRPADAFSLMRKFGIGISDEDLNKIPVGFADYNLQDDSDQDGLSYNMEISLGTNPNLSDSDQDGFNDKEEVGAGHNPNGGGSLLINKDFANKLKGKIFLQVEKNGEAWYVNPSDGKRYFLGGPADAFSVMRLLGLGISNDNLKKIKEERSSSLNYGIEKNISSLINKERTKVGLSPLSWNEDLAKVAREHSYNLAKENENFSGEGKACDLPIIHHEGTDFGLYNADRLNNRGIYYFSSAGENIALMPSAYYKIRYVEGDAVADEIDECKEVQVLWDRDFKEALDSENEDDNKVSIINSEVEKRTEKYEESSSLDVVEKEVVDNNEVEKNTVDGWMNSPGHKKNILDEGYDETGVGVAWVGDYLISTQVFIKRADCGFKDGLCCERRGCYLPYSCSENNFCE